MSSSLEGKVAVVTGGSSGIGFATATRFAAEGARVFITGRRQTGLDRAVADIGDNVTAVQADVSNLDDLDRLYATVEELEGTLDVVVACPTYVERVLTRDVTPQHFDLTFDTTARGTYFTVQKALPMMNDGGSIILIGSVGPVKGFPTRSTYNGAKAALGAFVLVPDRTRMSLLIQSAPVRSLDQRGTRRVRIDLVRVLSNS